MASVKYGVIVTEIKGSVGGHTFKGTQVGGVLQTKVNRAAAGKSGGKLTKADSGRLINPKRDTSQNARAWSALSAEQRTAWIAAAPSFPFINKFGEPYTGSGFQLFMQCNNNLLAIGEDPITSPPAVEEIENCPPFTIAAGGGDTFELTWGSAVPAGYTATIYSCFPQSAGRNLELGRMKAIINIPAGGGGSVSLDAAYTAVFGEIPPSGNVWFIGKLTKADSGRKGNDYTVQFDY